MSKIAIIGAGWFGCHLGASLRKDNDVTIYEQQPDIFLAASGLNQGRLHLGFHYPRSHNTREQALENYPKFMGRYGKFTHAIKDNVYAIAERTSVTDFQTYLTVMRRDGLTFEVASAEEYGLQKIEGCIRCDERSVDIAACKRHFLEELRPCLRLNCAVETVVNEEDRIAINGEWYDTCINCTNNQSLLPVPDTLYEACVMLTYEGFSPDFALTVMDGEFSSLFPCVINGRMVHTLTSVTHTPVRVTPDLAEAKRALSELKPKDIDLLRTLFEENIQTFYPAFAAKAKYVGFVSSIKTKFLSHSANRELFITSEKRLISMFCGKIASIFSAEDAVRRLLHAD